MNPPVVDLESLQITISSIDESVVIPQHPVVVRQPRPRPEPP